MTQSHAGYIPAGEMKKKKMWPIGALIIRMIMIMTVVTLTLWLLKNSCVCGSETLANWIDASSA